MQSRSTAGGGVWKTALPWASPAADASGPQAPNVWCCGQHATNSVSFPAALLFSFRNLTPAADSVKTVSAVYAMGFSRGEYEDGCLLGCLSLGGGGSKHL